RANAITALRSTTRGTVLGHWKSAAIISRSAAAANPPLPISTRQTPRCGPLSRKWRVRFTRMVKGSECPRAARATIEVCEKGRRAYCRDHDGERQRLPCENVHRLYLRRRFDGEG